MNSVARILESAFEKARKSGREIGRNTAAEAAHLRISAAHYSRIRNTRVPLTDKLISQFVEVFAEGDDEYAQKLKDELWAARGDAAQRVAEIPPPPKGDKYSVERAGELFEKLSDEKALLIVDYRDLPQAVDEGAYPAMAKKARAAVQSGLRMVLCQPFGSAESLMKKHNQLAEKIEENNLHDRPHAKSFLKAYLYLYDLATKVREFYQKMLEDSSTAKGQVVLYEADAENPLLVATGIQSRLFFADYYEESRHQTKIYEWVAVSGDEHFFVERSHLSLNIDAVKLQFNPIPAYWDKYERLPVGKEMDDAYGEFGLKSLFGEERGEVRWKDWSK